MALFNDFTIPIWEQSVAQTPEEERYYHQGMAYALLTFRAGIVDGIWRACIADARAYRYNPDVEDLFLKRMEKQAKNLRYEINKTRKTLQEASMSDDAIACKACCAHLQHLTPYVVRSFRPRDLTPKFFRKMHPEQLRLYWEERQKQR